MIELALEPDFSAAVRIVTPANYWGQERREIFINLRGRNLRFESKKLKKGV